MPKFEVHIPAAEGAGTSTTLKVDADNWMAALKAGMQRLGEQGTNVQNVLVDIQDDNSIHVTEPRNNRVFRIRELSEEEAAKAAVKRPSQIRPAVAKTELTLPAAGAREAMGPSDGTGGVDASGKPILQGKRPHVSKSSPRIDITGLNIQELEMPTRPITGSIGRPKMMPGTVVANGVTIEDLLAEVFERVQEINSLASPEAALDFILGLALEKVPADAGSVLRADAATGDLTFAVARGPKAAELLKSKIVIPAGSGIAGFCSSEGVSVAVSDVQKDPRHYAAISTKVDYETKSLVCSPMMTHGRSFGCVQLLNRTGGATFAEHEIGVLSYLSHQAALYLNDHS